MAEIFKHFRYFILFYFIYNSEFSQEGAMLQETIG